MYPFVQLKTFQKQQSTVFLQKAVAPQAKAVRRLRELDFLRGAAILLVLCRHQLLFEATTTMGWIGVDLFFVLSGFLISGLLFKEYQRFGNLKPSRFLIRRGFKIYPIYYLFYLPYLWLLADAGTVSLPKLLGDLFFVQNYVNGFGYGYVASWSLAIEEHFYFAFSLLLFLGLKYKWVVLRKEGAAQKSRFNELWVVVALLMLACLFVRIPTNLYLPDKYINRSFTMTHLRVDSLLAGVLVSYFYHFKKEALTAFCNRYKTALATATVLCLVWTPFIKPLQPLFIRTVGFTLLYIGFSLLLLFFLLNKNINQTLDRFLSKAVVDLVSKVGFCSYSIYVIHTLSNTIVHRLGPANNVMQFLLSTAISITCGFVMTHGIESYFLKLRDKYYPNRAV